MKFLWFRRFISLQRAAEAKPDDKKVRKVVKFVDCEIANRSFVIESMEEMNNRNQYVAAMTGEINQRLFECL